MHQQALLEGMGAGSRAPDRQQAAVHQYALLKDTGVGCRAPDGQHAALHQHALVEVQEASHPGRLRGGARSRPVGRQLLRGRHGRQETSQKPRALQVEGRQGRQQRRRGADRRRRSWEVRGYVLEDARLQRPCNKNAGVKGREDLVTDEEGGRVEEEAFMCLSASSYDSKPLLMSMEFSIESHQLEVHKTWISRESRYSFR